MGFSIRKLQMLQSKVNKMLSNAFCVMDVLDKEKKLSDGDFLLAQGFYTLSENYSSSANDVYFENESLENYKYDEIFIAFDAWSFQVRKFIVDKNNFSYVTSSFDELMEKSKELTKFVNESIENLELK